VKRTTTTKLKLKAETIRALEAKSLETVRGGEEGACTGTCPTRARRNTYKCWDD
jgi:hypothetical protein